MKIQISIFIFPLVLTVASAQPVFNDYFLNKTLRFDYIQVGNAESSQIIFKQLKEEPYWGGSKVNLVDTFKYGEYLLHIKDSITGILIYSRGYASLFQEWQTTDEAQHTTRSFYEVVLMPFPKRTVLLEICKRNDKNQFVPVFKQNINPSDIFIVKEKVPDYSVSEILKNGDPANKVDIVFLPDGYTKNEMKKFRDDCKLFADYLFSYSPYSEYKSNFNLWAVEAPSSDSGCDVPGKGIWKSTLFNSSFYTFGVERYVTTQDIKSVRDIAACVPYDQICILVNSLTYGGGGIYNFYNLFTSDNLHAGFVFVHELGHGFASLADEYYESEVAYNDSYKLDVEPYPPNITTLVNFESKWKNFVNDTIPIPTPPDSAYFNVIGVFEGGGYSAKGIYRPQYDCIMKSRGEKKFCEVCKRAIIEMIKFYSE